MVLVMYLFMFYYSYTRRTLFLPLEKKLKVPGGGRTMLKQNFTQNLTYSLEIEIWSFTLY